MRPKTMIVVLFFVYTIIITLLTVLFTIRNIYRAEIYSKGVEDDLQNISRAIRRRKRQNYQGVLVDADNMTSSD